ncbi:hypothetical protein Gotri_026440 [Gossypium trilobum]|uniref:Uncharacterized protein n=1 Tax=Gossypium trilobum TaxID=34281 RepID=A0A7J9FID7_9ROSI|nr:hypothetical protein [Gossypium trilobum]
MAPKKRPRTSASSSHQPSDPKSSFNEHFRTDAFRECFDKNFASKRVWESRKVDIAMLEGINFGYLSILQNLGWMNFLKISSLTYYNLVRAFFSNAKLEHEESYAPSKKHAKLQNIDYWWLDSFYTSRHPDLSLIMFNEITKAIGRGMSTNITLPHGTYLSYHFRRLGIITHGDTPVTSNQPISYGAFHHTGYRFDVTSGMWVKSDHLVENEDENVEGAFEDIPAPEHVPSPEHALPPVSSSPNAQPSFEINGVILDVIHSLSNDVQGLRDEVRSHRDEVNSSLSTLEMQMASLFTRFPSTPPFSPHDDV